MFDNVALNVVIGLVFIYLLYSLFATVLSEMIATTIGLRARNLREAVDRMLNDEPEGVKSFWLRLVDSFNLVKNPKNPRIINFYNHPEIKYLGSAGIFKVPSQFKAVSFSKTVLNLLNEVGYKRLHQGSTQMRDEHEGDMKDIPATQVTRERITAALEGIVEEHKQAPEEEREKIVFDQETAKYVLSLWHESYEDIVRFRLLLENWFDRTMEQCLEWYKRKIQIILLGLGFLMAWFFNADTFSIIHKLSNDKDAREKMVTLAAAYTERQQGATPLSGAAVTSAAQLDTLLGIKNKLAQDIADANSVLGSGGWPPDSVVVSYDPKTGLASYTPSVDEGAFSMMQGRLRSRNNTFYFDSWGQKWAYFFRLPLLHFFGFLITAIAISLGAPFWFDLLNKLMKLRTSVKQPTDRVEAVAGGVSPLNRVG